MGCLADNLFPRLFPDVLLPARSSTHPGNKLGTSLAQVEKSEGGIIQTWARNGGYMAKILDEALTHSIIDCMEGDKGREAEIIVYTNYSKRQKMVKS